MFASDLVRTLNDLGVSQRVAVLRGSVDDGVRFEASTRWLGGGRGSESAGGATSLRALRRAVVQWRPDIVQAHGGEALKYSVSSTVGTGAPIVYRRIGSVHEWTTSGLRWVAYAGLMRRAARIVAVADAVRRETVRVFHLPDRRVMTIPNGVDADRVRPMRGRDETRRELGLPPGAPVVLSLGAFTWEKDPLSQLELAGRLLAQRADAVFVLVGDGPMRGEIEGAVRGRGLDGRVLLLGARDDVADILGASDVMILASRTEGMPAAVIEAGIAGLPVAAFALGGVSEVVVDGTTGILAAPGDLATLAQGVLKLLADGDAEAAMGRAARERCLARFDIRAIAPRYLELYKELVEA